MLFIGERVGKTGAERADVPAVDIAVDPLEGTNLVAHGQAGAITVLAASEAGGLTHAPDTYLEKLCVGPGAAGKVDIRESPTENLGRIAESLGRKVSDISVVILERPRHDDLIAEVREAGARIKFITDGDVAGAIAAAREGTGVDLLLGIGGTPEGIIAACALKCMGGALQGKLWPKDDEERQKALDAGHDLDRVLHIDDLVRGDVFFVATGITDGELLRGVRYSSGGCTTQSLVLRSRSGTIRSIDSLHSLEKLRAYSAVPFDGEQ
jgi:fructose-1,6-bisphosphatase II